MREPHRSSTAIAIGGFDLDIDEAVCARDVRDNRDVFDVRDRYRIEHDRAVQSRVGEEIVGRRWVGRHRAENSGTANGRTGRHAIGKLLVLDADGDRVFAIPRHLVGNVGDEWQMPAQMLRYELPVDPHLGGVVHRADAQEHSLPAPA